MSRTDLAFLVSQYRAVEILDALARKSLALRDLRVQTHASRRPLARTLRLLGAHGMVRRTHPGSWDRLRPVGRYELTRQGHELADQLSVLDVWTDLYEHYL
ncbi:winged helix-turn-helix transcriptional regulator [Actinocrispum wychmicini]|uniref:winged helix-turn-helix transcriptional regulator n=1 Tax=Actinocrispum wychmicini TaxID=1213861 RepID=UPI001405113B|nr:winged helix-turn-helix transcriptional regulator [Actinocrispum wychmicini]